MTGDEKMKSVSCFELYPSILGAEKVNELLLELFPRMHTSFNEEGVLDIYITRQEYVFVLNELSKLNNYSLTMPEYVEDINVTLTSMPIECSIVERYSVLYDLMFEAEYLKKEVDNNVIASDMDTGGKYADMLTGNKFSQKYDVSSDCIKYLFEKMGDH
jgi:phosphoglycerate-specific signal transduction histidine kinase